MYTTQDGLTKYYVFCPTCCDPSIGLSSEENTDDHYCDICKSTPETIYKTTDHHKVYQCNDYVNQ